MSHSATKTTSSLRRLCRLGAALGALVLLGVAGSGCKGKGATGGCGDQDSLCGGSPIGTWEVTDTCSFPVVSRPSQNYDTTRGYYEPETGSTPPAQTSGFWCWDLSFDTDGKIKTPATPISNPGVASIQAAAHPAHASYLYYVAGADGCGEQVFSTTEAKFQQDVTAYEAAKSANGGHLPACKHG